MPKINQEEYEILKGLDDKWKWITKSWAKSLYAHDTEPWKNIMTLHWEGLGNSLRVKGANFQFIQWEDDEPYNIAELIEEYENNYKGSWEHVIEFSKEAFEESEEKEVKDIEWAKKEIESLMTEESQSYPHDKMVEQEIVLGILNQLEVETLSSEWIDENEEQEETYGTYGVPSRKLQNLLVPKQEKVVVDEELYEIIKEEKFVGAPLNDIFTFYNLGDEKDQELFARAWLAYPNIKIKREPQYRIKAGDNYLYFNLDGTVRGSTKGNAVITKERLEELPFDVEKAVESGIIEVEELKE